MFFHFRASLLWMLSSLFNYLLSYSCLFTLINPISMLAPFHYHLVAEFGITFSKCYNSNLIVVMKLIFNCYINIISQSRNPLQMKDRINDINSFSMIFHSPIFEIEFFTLIQTIQLMFQCKIICKILAKQGTFS